MLSPMTSTNSRFHVADFEPSPLMPAAAHSRSEMTLFRRNSNCKAATAKWPALSRPAPPAAAVVDFVASLPPRPLSERRDLSHRIRSVFGGIDEEKSQSEYVLSDAQKSIRIGEGTRRSRVGDGGRRQMRTERTLTGMHHPPVPE
jgi:hypothetical protein